MYLKKTVAAIIPAGKDSNSILKVIQELDATSFTDEIIIVNNGADEKTINFVTKTRARFIKTKKIGLGDCLKEGFRNTKADLIVVISGDGSFMGKDITKLLSYSEDFDTVFGSRTHSPLIGKGSGMTFSRRLVDDLFGKLISILFLSSNLTDVGCTFRLTNRKGLKKVIKYCKSKDEIFLTEWLIEAAKNKVRFTEVPVNFISSTGDRRKENFFFLATRAFKIIYLIFKTYFS
ncbi:hypothetical protein A2422_00825 [Candidatus Woesebacteria bacterium RIFOXYC1_FULL_31_51]|uniref:Glycosyl transferase, family 2 n=1 Tax=Candidatus Woesebacteria bacterium GW2011_GWC2_31_9 TaxID=1618586 RepID=A0A0F9Z0Q7_9BACT|nr:MAG: glycosyl transferase family protein [Candidatus Woesebacteria bacterium GW2011_GWF1_31_35]KKP22862.1 MAG: Glycosyl transferase, family 2 [Candidatus Woesebacteria bacterium GW2011_GWC1_30_29]KKP26650.1 MAG: Glycosyl transferase, family 2 [Candidatus Woesebacteria bacterium GW2011_GWD1_31_12]KKP28110.1 MAG: Glycosyl transferase, family 2 [Candidatus Woesebacteria bacterium GW2011_GWB1_31_29]KKP32221.1 MAG: Glycosyl transferase, family 2 [Candidatus Woesebacteria bacterium GW2011_GWC2_31_